MSVLQEMVDELKALVDNDAKHDPAMHEGKRVCEGCERIFLVNRIREYLQAEDDDKPQRRLGNKSRKETQIPEYEARWEDRKAKSEKARGG